MPVAPQDAVWKALADSNRRKMLAELSRRAMTTGDLVDSFSLSLVRTAVMKHLDILEGARLIRSEREGRIRWNHLEPRPLADAVSWLQRHTQTHEDNLVRLKALAEAKPGSLNTKPK